MVHKQTADLDLTFAALADPVRRAVIARLANGDEAVTALASDHAISLPAFMKHLWTLERAGLVETLKTGRVRTCRLCEPALAAAETWLHAHRAFWEAQLDSLERLFQPGAPETDPWPRTPQRNRSKSVASSPRRRPASSKRGPRRSS